jgi:hypothetical protein
MSKATVVAGLILSRDSLLSGHGVLGIVSVFHKFEGQVIE